MSHVTVPIPLTAAQHRKLSRGHPIQLSGKGVRSQHARVHHVMLDRKTHRGLIRAVTKGRGKRIYGQVHQGCACGGGAGGCTCGRGLAQPGAQNQYVERANVRAPGPPTIQMRTGPQIARGGTDQVSGDFLTRTSGSLPTYKRGYVSVVAPDISGSGGRRRGGY